MFRKASKQGLPSPVSYPLGGLFSTASGSSRSFSTGAEDAMGRLDPDELFAKFTVAEVKAVAAKLRYAETQFGTYVDDKTMQGRCGR